MPTYEYKCDSCDYRFETFQSMKADPLSKCPKCGMKIRRLISPGNGFIFKGSGFYSTDYRSENYKKEKEKESKVVSDSSTTNDKSLKTKKSTGVNNMA